MATLDDSKRQYYALIDDSLLQVLLQL